MEASICLLLLYLSLNYVSLYPLINSNVDDFQLTNEFLSRYFGSEFKDAIHFDLRPSNIDDTPMNQNQATYIYIPHTVGQQNYTHHNFAKVQILKPQESKVIDENIKAQEMLKNRMMGVSVEKKTMPKYTSNGERSSKTSKRVVNVVNDESNYDSQPRYQQVTYQRIVNTNKGNNVNEKMVLSKREETTENFRNPTQLSAQHSSKFSDASKQQSSIEKPTQYLNGKTIQLVQNKHYEQPINQKEKMVTHGSQQTLPETKMDRHKQTSNLVHLFTNKQQQLSPLKHQTWYERVNAPIPEETFIRYTKEVFSEPIQLNVSNDTVTKRKPWNETYKTLTTSTPAIRFIPEQKTSSKNNLSEKKTYLLVPSQLENRFRPQSPETLPRPQLEHYDSNRKSFELLQHKEFQSQLADKFNQFEREPENIYEPKKRSSNVLPQKVFYENIDKLKTYNIPQRTNNLKRITNHPIYTTFNPHLKHYPSEKQLHENPSSNKNLQHVSPDKIIRTHLSNEPIKRSSKSVLPEHEHFGGNIAFEPIVYRFKEHGQKQKHFKTSEQIPHREIITHEPIYQHLPLKRHLTKLMNSGYGQNSDEPSLEKEFNFH